MSQNPYEKIYDDLNIIITEQTTLEEAQTLARHLGHVYNTFGLIVKDFIQLMGHRFRSDRALPNDKNKKDKKTLALQTRTEKKSRSATEMEEEQLEGKMSTPPIGPIHQIQNYNHSENSFLEHSAVSLREKIHRLKESRNQSASQIEGENICDKGKFLNGNNSMREKQNDRNIHSQKQKEPNLNTSVNPQEPIRKAVTRRKRDHEVINISSQDEQKDEDSLSGVKTRAQHRGEQRPIMRPDSLLRRGRGRGRGRGRPSSRGSSRVDEDQDERKEAAYPMHPNDPFTIIYNVPYMSKLGSNGSICSTPSKKDQKMEKKLLKQMSESSNSQQLQSQQIEATKRGSKLTGMPFSNQPVQPSPYNNPSFIQKVMASYMQEKNLIKEKLDNLDKEYEKQRISFMDNKIGENRENDKDNQTAQNRWKNKTSRASQAQAQQREQDGYEYQVEEEISFEQLPEQEEEGNFDVEQQVLVEQEEQGLEEQEEQPLPFEKLNPSPKPRHCDQNESYNYLQQINQCIQQEFEQNFRMNQQIDQDEEGNEIQNQNDIQNANEHENEYEEEVSYSSLVGIEAQLQPVLKQSQRVQQEVVVEENQNEQGQIEKEHQIEEQNINQRKQSEVPNAPEQTNIQKSFENLFLHIPHALHISHAQSFNSNQPRTSQVQQQIILDQQQQLPIQNVQAPSIYTIPHRQPQPEAYFPFAHSIPQPSINNNKTNQQPSSNKELISKDNKEELLRVLDEFESDSENEPKKDAPKLTIHNENIRQAFMSKFAWMKNNQLNIGHTVIPQNSSQHNSLEMGNGTAHFGNSLSPDKTVQQENNSLQQNKTTTISPNSSTLPPHNHLSKSLQNPTQYNKNTTPTEFVPYAKKTRHIEVIELE